MLTEAIAPAGQLLELFGVGLMVVGVAIATILSVPDLFGYGGGNDVLKIYKVRIGRAMLLGLEVLMAASIVKTVALEPTLNTMTALALLVMVRTTLSWSLVLEVDGRWPWRPRPSKNV